MLINDMKCCGIIELVGMDSPPEDLVKHFKENYYDMDDDVGDDINAPVFVVFSDIPRGKSATYSGEKFAKYLTTKKLGKVTKVGRRLNPNSGNNLTMWTWQPDLNKLYKKCKTCGKR